MRRAHGMTLVQCGRQNGMSVAFHCKACEIPLPNTDTASDYTPRQLAVNEMSCWSLMSWTSGYSSASPERLSCSPGIAYYLALLANQPASWTGTGLHTEAHKSGLTPSSERHRTSARSRQKLRSQYLEACLRP